jgi:hypothetical protein
MLGEGIPGLGSSWVRLLLGFQVQTGGVCVCVCIDWFLKFGGPIFCDVAPIFGWLPISGP